MSLRELDADKYHISIYCHHLTLAEFVNALLVTFYYSDLMTDVSTAARP